MKLHQSDTAERWLPVVGYEGLYEVSDRGCIRSLSHMDGNGRTRPGRIRRLVAQKPFGHLALMLSREGVNSKRYIHRLVLEAFVGPALEGQHGCHGDGDPSNNRLTNLRWDWPRENNADKRRHGTYRVGERVPTAKLSAVDIERIRDIKRAGCRQSQIARYFGISPALVSSILSGKRWIHLAVEAC